jgi:hypothetical protein
MNMSAWVNVHAMELTEILVCELGRFRLVALGDLMVTITSSSSRLA